MTSTQIINSCSSIIKIEHDITDQINLLRNSIMVKGDGFVLVDATQ